MSDASTYNEEPYPQKRSSSSGGLDGYSVEARYMYPAPLEVAGQIFDSRWRRVEFSKVPAGFGVPSGSFHEWQFTASGLHSYPAAQALRWWLHAACAVDYVGGCLETRVVKHKITYSLEWQAVSDHSLIGGEDRSNSMPDWDKQ